MHMLDLRKRQNTFIRLYNFFFAFSAFTSIHLVIAAKAYGSSGKPITQIGSIRNLQYTGFPGGSVVKNLPANAGDTGSI